MIEIQTSGGATYAPDWEAVAALNKKLAAVMDAIGRMEKDAENTYQKYKYVSYEHLAAIARQAITEQGLSFTAGISDVETWQTVTNKGSASFSRLAHIEMVFTDVETGAMRVLSSYGEGQDTQDKATAKALTAGVKYGLMRALLVSDQEADPDISTSSHWIDNDETRKLFWGWTKNTLGLAQKDVYRALGIEHIHDFSGTKKDAQVKIEAWLEEV